MNNINASSLFHFTKDYGTLQNIIKNGLRYSFAFENLSPKIIANFADPYAPVAKTYQKAGVAIPMVSFCDIPITRSLEHIDKYGGYIIGLDKDFIIRFYNLTLNPVIYINSKNLIKCIEDLAVIYAELEKNVLQLILNFSKKGDAQFNLNQYKDDLNPLLNRKFNVKFIVGLVKACYDKYDLRCYYDEREWRAILMDGLNDVSNWKCGVVREEYDAFRLKWNNELSKSKDNFFTVSENNLDNVITHIVVKSEKEIPEIINAIMKLNSIFGSVNVTEKDRLVLISKVTSLERIGKDY